MRFGESSPAGSGDASASPDTQDVASRDVSRHLSGLPVALAVSSSGTGCLPDESPRVLTCESSEIISNVGEEKGKFARASQSLPVCAD